MIFNRILPLQTKKFFLQIFAKSLLVISLYVSPAICQFDDIATVLPQQTLPKLSVNANQFILENNATEYNHLGVIEGVAVLVSSDSSPTVTFRLKNPAGQWSDWQPALILAEPFSNRTYAAYRGALVTNSVEFEYRVRVDAGIPKVEKTGVFIRQDEVPNGTAKKTGKRSGNVRKPAVISRAQWAARNPKERYDPHPYFDKLTLHHAAGFRAENREEGIIQMQAIQRLHQDIRGWNDIGYHFVVDQAGNIYQARPEYVIGAHVGGANTGNIGICVLGCYHPPEAGCDDRLSQATLDSLVAIYGWVADTYAYDPAILLGHRDYFGSTACPGDNLWPTLPSLREQITEYIGRQGVPDEFYLNPSYPNPFSPVTTISFHLPVEQQVEIKIYNIRGRLVHVLPYTQGIAGLNTVKWDGRGADSKEVASGAYFYSLQANGQQLKGKMVRLNRQSRSQ